MINLLCWFYVICGFVTALLGGLASRNPPPKAPAFFYTIGLVIIFTLWPLFVLSAIEEQIWPSEPQLPSEEKK